MPEHNINKLVSLTFDENPDVRRQAAVSLSLSEDPAAIFALVELSFDKDPTVRLIAQQKLDEKKQKEAEVMSFAEIFASNEKKEEKTEKEKTTSPPMDAKEKMLQPITQIFERRLGKEKAAAVRSKMMPTIEKIYMNSVKQTPEVEKTDENGRKVMQEFLASYLEVMSDLETIAPPKNAQILQNDQKIEEKIEPNTSKEIAAVIGEISRPNNIIKAGEEIEKVQIEEGAEIQQDIQISNLPGTYFKKAYEIMMLSNGDETIMEQEMERMVNDANREISLAFKLAKKRFKQNKVTNITNITDGMKNINTEPLLIKLVEKKTYAKTKKQMQEFFRIVTNDLSGNEGIIYLFEDKGEFIKAGVRVKIENGVAKSFEFSAETAIVLGKKGNIYIVL